MLIFERSRPGRRNRAQAVSASDRVDLPERLLRRAPPLLPEVSELDALRHYTALSQKNFSIDTHFYPLGSCTMKYNPRGANALAMLPQFLARHPDAPDATGQGFLACLYELQQMLEAVTGMAAVSLAPMAGAQGELAGVAMIRAYHDARGDSVRAEILVPAAAHGTNPATAVMSGYTVREIPVDARGNVDMPALCAAVGPRTAGLMLTNPSTLGVFEQHILEIQRVVHAAGGLLYYDGANLNAILGKVKPADMGFDAIHINLHKTFSTPHGGGGPGSGPVGVGPKLVPFLPVPLVTAVQVSAVRASTSSARTEGRTSSARTEGRTSSARTEGRTSSARTDGRTSSARTQAPTRSARTDASTSSARTDAPTRSAPSAPVRPEPVEGQTRYRLLWESDRPQSIGRLGAHLGNAGVLLRAYAYARMLGAAGMRRVAEFATLNANYLMAELERAGFEVAYPQRRASHEFIVTLKRLKDETGVTAMDFAKRLLDKGFHAPTTYFPQLVPECLLIEPTETESKQTLDAFVAAMKAILDEARADPQRVKTAPHTTPVRRLDEVRAARELDLKWQPR